MIPKIDRSAKGVDKKVLWLDNFSNSESGNDKLTTSYFSQYKDEVSY